MKIQEKQVPVYQNAGNVLSLMGLEFEAFRGMCQQHNRKNPRERVDHLVTFPGTDMRYLLAQMSTIYPTRTTCLGDIFAALEMLIGRGLVVKIPSRMYPHAIPGYPGFVPYFALTGKGEEMATGLNRRVGLYLRLPQNARVWVPLFLRGCYVTSTSLAQIQTDWDIPMSELQQAWEKINTGFLVTEGAVGSIGSCQNIRQTMPRGIWAAVAPSDEDLGDPFKSKSANLRVLARRRMPSDKSTRVRFTFSTDVYTEYARVAQTRGKSVAEMLEEDMRVTTLAAGVQSRKAPQLEAKHGN
jgi:hypothetical protein